ncbi:MAG TPA: CBS domain-containing protein [Alphaproteobacteria bacterium]|nr:CBS domain-containing protein [Alphaproteobacteria bacterium]
MRTSVTALPANTTMAELEAALGRNETGRGQVVYPVVGPARRLVGVLTRSDLQRIRQTIDKRDASKMRLADIMRGKPFVVYPDQPLRTVVNHMAATSVTRFPVVKRGEGLELAGLVTLQDLLKAREASLHEENHRERPLRLRLPPSLRWHGRPEEETGASNGQS